MSRLGLTVLIASVFIGLPSDQRVIDVKTTIRVKVGKSLNSNQLILLKIMRIFDSIAAT